MPIVTVRSRMREIVETLFTSAVILGILIDMKRRQGRQTETAQ